VRDNAMLLGWRASDSGTQKFMNSRRQLLERSGMSDSLRRKKGGQLRCNIPQKQADKRHSLFDRDDPHGPNTFGEYAGC
jgi:hypothetical protein